MKKILVIGGAYQGKKQWVNETFPQYKEYNVLDLKNTSDLIRINDFHILMKQWISNNFDYMDNVKKICNMNSWIIISDEIGNGIVPINKEERIWREETGRTLTFIAKNADEVYRIYCGIPTKIKEPLIN